VNDRIALALAGFVAGLILLDLVANGGEALLFLIRKLFVFVEFLTFWH